MRPKKGFSLIELMIVVLILGVLATIAIPRIMGGATIARINACKTNVKMMNRQIMWYYHNESKWPINFNALTTDPNYFPDGSPECTFGNPYTIHGSKHWINQHSH
ncbi:MAG: competence type IV pilus major pilin ComGC [Planctomycetota bacterium]